MIRVPVLYSVLASHVAGFQAVVSADGHINFEVHEALKDKFSEVMTIATHEALKDNFSEDKLDATLLQFHEFDSAKGEIPCVEYPADDYAKRLEACNSPLFDVRQVDCNTPPWNTFGSESQWICDDRNRIPRSMCRTGLKCYPRGTKNGGRVAFAGPDTWWDETYGHLTSKATTTETTKATTTETTKATTTTFPCVEYSVDELAELFSVCSATFSSRQEECKEKSSNRKRNRCNKRNIAEEKVCQAAHLCPPKGTKA